MLARLLPHMVSRMCTHLLTDCIHCLHPCRGASWASPACACCPSATVRAPHTGCLTQTKRSCRGLLQGTAVANGPAKPLCTRCFRAGMRFIVNLGRSSTVRFAGAKMRTGGTVQHMSCRGFGGSTTMPPSNILRSCAQDIRQQSTLPAPSMPYIAGPGGKRRQRSPAVKLDFRPVNSLLQGVYQVGGWRAVNHTCRVQSASVQSTSACSFASAVKETDAADMHPQALTPAGSNHPSPCRCCGLRRPASPTCWAPQVCAANGQPLVSARGSVGGWWWVFARRVGLPEAHRLADSCPAPFSLPCRHAVFGHNDAFCRLQPFLRKWRAAAEAASAAGTALQPYIGALCQGPWQRTFAGPPLRPALQRTLMFEAAAASSPSSAAAAAGVGSLPPGRRRTRC